MTDEISPNSKELLIRIDERQKSMVDSVKRIEDGLLLKVNDNQDYKDMVAQHKIMWDGRSKAMGYIAAWTGLLSFAGYFIAKFVEQFFK